MQIRSRLAGQTGEQVTTARVRRRADVVSGSASTLIKIVPIKKVAVISRKENGARNIAGPSARGLFARKTRVQLERTV